MFIDFNSSKLVVLVKPPQQHKVRWTGGNRADQLERCLRKQIPFLQRLLIPNAIIAGLIILILSQKVINLINIPAGSMDTLVYHLLTGVFISLGLQQRRGINYRVVVTTTAIISISYAVLAVVGILFTLFWSAVLFRGFHPAFSMLPLLGFGYDHVIASSVGLQWESVGFMWGGQAG
jgi:hypothetical protein